MILRSGGLNLIRMILRNGLSLIRGILRNAKEKFLRKVKTKQKVKKEKLSPMVSHRGLQKRPSPSKKM